MAEKKFDYEEHKRRMRERIKQKPALPQQGLLPRLLDRAKRKPKI